MKTSIVALLFVMLFGFTYITNVQAVTITYSGYVYESGYPANRIQDADVVLYVYYDGDYHIVDADETDVNGNYLVSFVLYPRYESAWLWAYKDGYTINFFEVTMTSQNVNIPLVPS